VTTTTVRLPLRADLPERVGVLVLGSGLAGCAALLAAAEAGRPAVMLEKTDAIGGSTVKSGALLAFSGTDEQRAQGTTDSGLTIDTHLRVLNWWDEPIERLYAAGEIVGGFHGSGYMTGTALGKAAIFGHLAGNQAAQEESENDNVDKVGK
jgi:succinate dehydrogenase/fumarate reductase flavoprotein subunit